MYRKALLVFLLTIVVLPCSAQEVGGWNFNLGGGVGFPLKNTSNFINDGANIVVGAGPNFGRFFGIDGEFMWQDFPIKQSVLTLTGAPAASARQYSLSGNVIFRIPTGTRLGLYAIGGGGWYHASGELTTPTVVPGTVCAPFYVFWGVCTSGLIPVNAVIASRSENAFGGNIGGGLSFRLRGRTKFYSEVRYHHASYNIGKTDILPLTFGLRW
jgi:opacity protein-like surface antigen